MESSSEAIYFKIKNSLARNKILQGMKNSKKHVCGLNCTLGSFCQLFPLMWRFVCFVYFVYIRMFQILDTTVVEMFNILQNFLNSNIFSNILQILMMILNSYSLPQLTDFMVVFFSGLNIINWGCPSKMFTLVFTFLSVMEACFLAFRILHSFHLGVLSSIQLHSK